MPNPLSFLFSILKRLAFREENPKHFVFHLTPLHVVFIAIFAYFAPALIFLNLMPFGLLTMIAGEWLLVLGTLEVLHIFFDVS